MMPRPSDVMAITVCLVMCWSQVAAIPYHQMCDAICGVGLQSSKCECVQHQKRTDETCRMLCFLRVGGNACRCNTAPLTGSESKRSYGFPIERRQIEKRFEHCRVLCATGTGGTSCRCNTSPLGGKRSLTERDLEVFTSQVPLENYPAGLIIEQLRRLKESDD
ncbi:uncharacterized protein LOC141907515 [Tubulanus polymorphus]|uniref:uncharacterized protein LOC141907515 n=1 Tax=Tubulanus polymorphus TaxID=672921 RepID=UPI003DA663CD